MSKGESHELPQGDQGDYMEEEYPGKFQVVGTASMKVQVSGTAEYICRTVDGLQLLKVEGKLGRGQT